NLDGADHLALVGEEKLQLEAVARHRRVVGIDPQTAEADVDGLAPAEERLSYRPAEDGCVHTMKLAPVVHLPERIGRRGIRRVSCSGAAAVFELGIRRLC